MKLTDRELWQARSLQDFRFRLGFEENSRVRNVQEHFNVLYKGASFEAKITAVLVLPDLSRVWLTDHSDWDGNVDFKPMRAMGARGTFIKAMEGTVPSRRYVDNTLRAKDEGLAVAPYHWLHQNSKVNGKAQAQRFWERVSPYVSKLPPMIDHEWTYWAGAAAYPTYADLDIFVTEFTRVSDIKPLWYSAPGYMNALGKMPTALRAKFAGFVVANYGVAIPNMPIGFTQDDWDFWQFAATGDADKISPNDAGKKEVDLIYSDLTRSGFDRRYGTSVPNPEPDPDDGTGEPMPTYIGLVKSTAPAVINIRSSPNGADIGDIERGTAFEGTGELVSAGGFTWMQWVRPVAGWVATVNLDYQVVTPTPEPSGLPVFNVDVTVSGAGYVTQKLIVEMRPE